MIDNGLWQRTALLFDLVLVLAESILHFPWLPVGGDHGIQVGYLVLTAYTMAETESISAELRNRFRKK